jgi:hypothetical protein
LLIERDIYSIHLPYGVRSVKPTELPLYKMLKLRAIQPIIDKNKIKSVVNNINLVNNSLLQLKFHSLDHNTESNFKPEVHQSTKLSKGLNVA